MIRLAIAVSIVAGLLAAAKQQGNQAHDGDLDLGKLLRPAYLRRTRRQAGHPDLDMCYLLNQNPKYDRRRAVVSVYVNGQMRCKALLMTRNTAVLTDVCVSSSEHPQNVYATPDDDPGDIHYAEVITRSPPGSIIHTVKFRGSITDPGFNPGLAEVTCEAYLTNYGLRNNTFPRLNAGFPIDFFACAIPTFDLDVEVTLVNQADCSSTTTLRADQECFMAPNIVSPESWLGQPLIFVHDDLERTPFVHGFVSSIVNSNFLVVDQVSAVANDIGCLDSVSGFWMNHTEHYINDHGLAPSSCARETWLSHVPPVCGIHPPLCLTPMVHALTPNNVGATCPVTQNLQVNLWEIVCCDNDQPIGCYCHDYQIGVKCPW